MHDQEPLMPSFYNHAYLKAHARSWYLRHHSEKTAAVMNHVDWQEKVCNSNLAFPRLGLTEYDRNILVHSELRSSHVKFYQDLGLETVYWWSHAMISRDWYRYALHDQRLQRPKNPDHYFNIYARAWHYPREYRLKLLDLIISEDLVSQCRVKFNAEDQNCHYRQYDFHRPEMAGTNDLAIFDSIKVDPGASASYSAVDYSHCWIDVVLETLFDDHRLHLTEKILRPIACGMPFILCATKGSLEYLRSYGFKTFHDVFDEGYDDIEDPLERLKHIVSTMKHISNHRIMDDSLVRNHVMEICRHNRAWFFSDDFSNNLVEEFKKNFADAKRNCDQHRNGKLRALRLEIKNQRSM